MSYFEKRQDGSYAPRQSAQNAPNTPPSQAHQTYQTPQYTYRPPASAQSVYTRPSAQNYQANYQSQHSLRYDPAPQKPPKKKRMAPKILGGTALVMACAVAGFGGSAAAIQLFGPSGDASIVYQNVGGNATANEISTTVTGIADIAQGSGQSVVSIQTELQLTNMFNQTQSVTGAGSGVIISEDGLILTNHHVVEGAQSIQVTLGSGEKYKATLIGSDSATDVALLRVEAEGLTPAVLGDSDQIQVGDFCLAIGNPTGELGGTVTDGIISGLEREITIQGTPMTLLQMSAPVSPGNSGGGLFDENGELVALVNAKSSGDGIEGLGFAIPINTAMDVAEELLQNGYVQGRPMLGVSAVSVTEETMASAGVNKPGLYINDVSAGSGAEAAGLQAGDRIVSFEGTAIDDLTDLSRALAEYSPGDTVTLEVERANQLYSVDITLQEQQPVVA